MMIDKLLYHWGINEDITSSSYYIISGLETAIWLDLVFGGGE